MRFLLTKSHGFFYDIVNKNKCYLMLYYKMIRRKWVSDRIRENLMI